MKHHRVDVVVVGGGHAGVEAALICDHYKIKILLITMDPSAIGRMSCNPAIGGLAKGQMVREIDVLGGQMAATTDSSGIQFKILNKKKGRAVWSPRAQVDKRCYEKLVLEKIKKSSVEIITGEVVSLLYKKNRVAGVTLRSLEQIYSKTVILTAGTFLSGTIHIGERKINAGRMGEERAEGLTQHLESAGFKSGRLKTGTPPRLNRKSINWSKADLSLGDTNPVPFSYSTKTFNPTNEPCHTLYSNDESHQIIKKNRDRSPMFSGDIGGVGPRYCPSIEDKVFKFPDRDSHLLFLEPEWTNSDQIYLNGFSTSLPEETQIESLRVIPGLENVDFFRPGYAIEYDFFPPSQLKNTLETKDVSGLFFAGQMNGTSGYEEAAAQGLVCGINASLKVLGKEQLVLTRDSSYIGVMIDDLITKDTLEPYRMFTSRAEFRLALRYSNTPDRLLEKAVECGSIRKSLEDLLLSVIKQKQNMREGLGGSMAPDEIKKITHLKHSAPAKDVLKRNEVSIWDLPKRYLKYPPEHPAWLVNDTIYDVESDIKYEGYIKRCIVEMRSLRKNEKIKLQNDLNYGAIPGLSSEAIEKLSTIKPENLGQAMRVSGITPSDMAVLAIHAVKESVSRGTT